MLVSGGLSDRCVATAYERLNVCEELLSHQNPVVASLAVLDPALDDQRSAAALRDQWGSLRPHLLRLVPTHGHTLGRKPATLAVLLRRMPLDSLALAFAVLRAEHPDAQSAVAERLATLQPDAPSTWDAWVTVCAIDPCDEVADVFSDAAGRLSQAQRRAVRWWCSPAPFEWSTAARRVAMSRVPAMSCSAQLDELVSALPDGSEAGEIAALLAANDALTTEGLSALLAGPHRARAWDGLRARRSASLSDVLAALDADPEPVVRRSVAHLVTCLPDAESLVVLSGAVDHGWVHSAVAAHPLCGVELAMALPVRAATAGFHRPAELLDAVLERCADTEIVAALADDWSGSLSELVDVAGELSLSR